MYSNRGLAVFSNDGVMTLENWDSDISSSSVITAILVVEKVYSTYYTLAADLEDGTMVISVYKDDDGNSASVEKSLSMDDKICFCSTEYTFAAPLNYGNVIKLIDK